MALISQSGTSYCIQSETVRCKAVHNVIYSFTNNIKGSKVKEVNCGLLLSSTNSTKPQRSLHLDDIGESRRGHRLVVAASPPTDDTFVATEPLMKGDLIGYLASGCKSKEKWRSNIFTTMSIRWPRFLTPSQLSQIIRSQQNSLKALEIFREAKCRYPNYRHNSPIYSTIIGILGNSGRISEIKEVICQMRDDSCECQDSVFVGAIKTYAKAGLLDEAISLFRTCSFCWCHQKL